MALKSYQEAIIMTVLFTALILAFSYQFLSSQNPSSDALVGGYGIFNDTDINATLQSYSSLSTSIKNMTSSASPDPVNFIFLIFEAAFEIPKAFLYTISLGIKTLGDVLYSSAGGGWGGAFQIVLSVVLAMLVVRLVVYIIEAIRTGSSGR